MESKYENRPGCSSSLIVDALIERQRSIDPAVPIHSGCRLAAAMTHFRWGQHSDDRAACISWERANGKGQRII